MKEYKIIPMDRVQAKKLSNGGGELFGFCPGEKWGMVRRTYKQEANKERSNMAYGVKKGVGKGKGRPGGGRRNINKGGCKLGGLGKGAGGGRGGGRGRKG